MPKNPISEDFQVILSSSSWSKTTFFVFFKEQIWLPNRKCHGKKQTLFSPEKNTQNGLIVHACRFLDMPVFIGKGFEAVHLDVSNLWAIYMHYLGNYSS